MGENMRENLLGFLHITFIIIDFQKKEQISFKSKQNKSLKVDGKFMFKEVSWKIINEIYLYEVRILKSLYFWVHHQKYILFFICYNP